jgi:hypothetical protein
MKYRVAIGVLAVLAFQLCSYKQNPLDLADAVWHSLGRDEDEVSRYEKRFEAVKGQLPDHGTVGYRTDDLLKRELVDYFVYEADGLTLLMEGKKSYLLAQYALAPVIVDRTHEYPLTVENRKAGVRVVAAEGK